MSRRGLAIRLLFVSLLLAFCASCKTTGSGAGSGYHYLVDVKKGDSLASIASKHGTTWQAIARENGLRDYRDIKVGQRLSVTPGPGGYTAGVKVAGFGKIDSITRSTTSESARASHTGFWFSPDDVSEGLRNEANVIDDGELIPGLGDGPEEELAADELQPKQYQTAPANGHPGKISSGSNADAFLIWPAKGDVSSYFGVRGRRMHKGIDIMAVRGSNVLAAADGKVVHTGYQAAGYGRFAVIDHGRLRTLYAHCQKVLVHAGQSVRQGDVIALVGATGHASGYHLHFELRDDDAAPMDPIPYIKNENLVSMDH